MEEFFSNHALNKKANNIVSTIEKIARPMAAPSFSMMSLHNTGLRIAEDLLNSCLPDLKEIKQQVGANDETYLEISSALAVTASGIIKMPVSAINMMASAQDFHADKQSVIRSKSDLAEATKLMSIISSLDLSSRARQTISQNLGILNTAEQKVNKANSGCYIATNIYGSYNSQEVLVLRSFRDNQLNKTFFGTEFIKIYYAISPTLVRLYGENTYFNKTSKFFLDHLVKFIR